MDGRVAPPLKDTQAPPSLPSHHALRVRRVDPQVVVVAVRRGHLG
jgi:hypothetical protein